MRDSERIPHVLKEIERIWRRHPDSRLGQLMCNLADWAEEHVWDIEEETVLREIETHLTNLDQIEREAEVTMNSKSNAG